MKNRGGKLGIARGKLGLIPASFFSSVPVPTRYGTFSTGINLRNLHSIILASPSKSRIRVLQSIGRGLRITNDK